MSERVLPLALCTRCHAPLIGTTAFRKYEWYCLECGAKLGYMSPDKGEPTPELNARYEALDAEWNEHAGPHLRVGRWWFESCDQCKVGDTSAYHEAHATDEERERHDAALKWLDERASRP